MSKSVVYVGVDVGKVEVVAAVTGRRARTFRHTGHGISGLVRWLGGVRADGCVQVCMEATGIYSRRLALRLLQYTGITVSIINPAQITAYRQVLLRRTKTDAVDAEVILGYAQSQHPPEWQPGSRVTETLTALVKQADRLRRLSIQSRNRREHNDADPKVVQHSERSLQRCLQAQITVLEQAIEQLCAADPELANQVALLSTIPGMGSKSALHLLSYGGRAVQERSAKQLTAHAGLAPQHRLSGISIRGRSRLNKQGDRRLRTILYMPTLVATKHNPIIARTFRQMVERGKAKKLALVACMRKLLVMCRAVLRTKRPFDPLWGLT